MEKIERITMTEGSTRKVSVSNIMSILTILFLSCVIVIFSALVSDLVIKMRNGVPSTIVYQEAVYDEEPTTLTVFF